MSQPTRCLALAVALWAAGCGNSLKSRGMLDGTTDGADDGTDGAVTCTSDGDCDDGDPCNGEETCGTDGVCEPGTPLSDGAPCEEDGIAGRCREGDCVPDTCGNGEVEAGEECDDGNGVSGDGCEVDCSYSCHTGGDCDDHDVCTDDICAEGGSGRVCSHEDNTAACDDGNPCTEGDACSEGTCVPGTNMCECETTGDCAEHEDGNLCNGTLVCSTETNLCIVDPGTVVTCSPTSTLCHVLVCVPETGACVDDNPSAGTACEDDSNACTEDECDGEGACVHAAITCSDGNQCTDDTCDTTSGCVFTPHTRACNDGNACTTGEACSGGSCTGGSTVVCDDTNQCTDDSCNTSTGCVFTPHTRSCDDGDPCTGPDVCSGGTCSGPGLPVWYHDGDHDYYGDSSDSVCASTAPTDYVSSSGDCCDSNASVRPGQYLWFTEAYMCGTTRVDFDYNCNGVEERHWTAMGSCVFDSSTGACVFTPGWTGSGTGPPACGVLGTWLGGCMSGGPGVCNVGAVTERRQDCH